MIESISMQGVASFQNPTPVLLNLNKKIVLFYGHNGTGKSTVARYLQDTTHSNYSNCSYVLPNAQDYQILVYNTDFVEKNFSQDSFEGVFTLGETNVAAEQAISAAEEEIVKLEGQRTQKQTLKKHHEDKEVAKIKAIKDKCFERTYGAIGLVWFLLFLFHPIFQYKPTSVYQKNFRGFLLAFCTLTLFYMIPAAAFTNITLAPFVMMIMAMLDKPSLVLQR